MRLAEYYQAYRILSESDPLNIPDEIIEQANVFYKTQNLME